MNIKENIILSFKTFINFIFNNVEKYYIIFKRNISLVCIASLS